MPDEHQHIIHTIRFELITDDRGFALQMQDMVSEVMQVDLILALNQVLSNHAIPGRHFQFDKVQVNLKNIESSQFKIELIRQVPVELSRQLDALITKYNYSQLPTLDLKDTDQQTYTINTLAKYLETGIWSIDTTDSKPDPQTILIQLMDNTPGLLESLISRIRSNPGKTVPRLAALLSQADLMKFIKSSASQLQYTIFKSLAESLFETIAAIDKIARIPKERWEESAKRTIVKRFVETHSRQVDPVTLAREVTVQLLNEYKLPSYVAQVDKFGKIKISPMLASAITKKKEKVPIEQIVKEIQGLDSKDEIEQLNVDWPPDGFTPLPPDDAQKDEKKKQVFKSEKQAMEEIQKRIQDQAAIEEVLKKATQKVELADLEMEPEDALKPESENETESASDEKDFSPGKPEIKPPDISGALFRYLTGGSPWWEMPATIELRESEDKPMVELMRVSPNQIISLFKWLRKANQAITRQTKEDQAVEAMLAIRSGALVARLMSGITADTAENLLAELYPGQQRLIRYLELAIQYLTGPLAGILKQRTAQPLKQVLLTQYIEGKKSITNLKEARGQIYKAVDALIPAALRVPFLQALAKFGPGRDLEETATVKGKPWQKLIEIPVLRKFAEEWPAAITSVEKQLIPETRFSELQQPDEELLEKEATDTRKYYSTSMLNQLAQFIKQSEPEFFEAETGKENLQKLIQKLSEKEKFDPAIISESEAKMIFSFLAAIMPDRFVKAGLEVMLDKASVPDADTLTDVLNRVFTAATPVMQPKQQFPPRRKEKATEKIAEIQKDSVSDKEADVSEEYQADVEPSKTPEQTKPSEQTQAGLPEAQTPRDQIKDRVMEETPESEKPSVPETPILPETEKNAIKKEKHPKDDPQEDTRKKEEVQEDAVKDEDVQKVAAQKEEIPSAERPKADTEIEKTIPPAVKIPPLTPEITVQDEVWKEMLTRMREGVWALKLLEQSYDMPLKTLNDLTEDMARALFLVYVGDGKIPPELLLEGVPVEKPAIVAWLKKIMTQKPAWLYKLLVQTIGNPAAITRLTEVFDEKSTEHFFEFLSHKHPAILPWIRQMREQSKNWFESTKDKTLMLKTLAAIAIKPTLDVENVYLYFLRLHLKLAEKEFGKTPDTWLEFWQKSAPEVTLQPEKFAAALKLMEQQIDNRKSRPDFSKYFDMDTERSSGSKFTEKVMVNNAGIVLMNPFLAQLFKVTELLDEKRQFKSQQHVWQAIQMLNYAVTKQKTTQEHTTFLSKIICGMEPDWLPPDENSFDEKHIPIIESMLQALIGQWTALGKSSNDNLRGSFLFRSGLLFDEGNRWTLTVEQKPWDILVEKIPWTIGLIKLPWMKKRIQVTWR